MSGLKNKMVALTVVLATLIAMQFAPLAAPSASALSLPSMPAPTVLADNSFDLSDCMSIGNPLSWFICPAMGMFSDATQAMDNLIAGSLKVDTGNKSAMHHFYNAWSVIRNISFGLAILAALIVIVLHMMGIEALSAYTVQKAVPRVAVALIGITLSWVLCMWFIGFVNDLGNGVRDLIYSTIKSTGVGVGNIAAAVVIDGLIAGGVGVLFLLSAGVIFPMLALGALSALVAIMTLVMRQLLLVVLVITAPIAIACYILPGTQKFWKYWWDSFSKGLMMYPIIMAFIAAGHTFAAIFAESNTMGAMISFIVYFAPYFMLPMTFKMAGSVVGGVGGMLQQGTAGMRQGLQKRRNAAMSKRFGDVRSQHAFKNMSEGRRRGALNKFLARATNIDSIGINPTKWNEDIDSAVQRRERQEPGHILEDPDFVDKQDDAFGKAMSLANNEQEFRKLLKDMGRSDESIDLAAGNWRKLKKRYSIGSMHQAGLLASLAAGNTEAEGSSEWLESAIRIANGDSAILSDLIGKGRSALMSSGAFSQGGASHGTTVELAKDMEAEMRAAASRGEAFDRSAFDKKLASTVYRQQGAGVLSHASAKGKDTAWLVEAARDAALGAVDNFDAAQVKLDTAEANFGTNSPEYAAARVDHQVAQDKMDAELAYAENIRDTLLTTSPEKAEAFATGVFGQKTNLSEYVTVDGSEGGATTKEQLTLKQVTDRRRSSPVFQQRRREYQAEEESRLRVQVPGGPGAPGSLPPTPTGGPRFTP